MPTYMCEQFSNKTINNESVQVKVLYFARTAHDNTN